MGTHYARAETDRVGERKRDPVKCKLYDARSPAIRKGLPMCHVMEQVDNLIWREIPPPFSYFIDEHSIWKCSAWCVLGISVTGPWSTPTQGLLATV